MYPAGEESFERKNAKLQFKQSDFLYARVRMWRAKQMLTTLNKFSLLFLVFLPSLPCTAFYFCAKSIKKRAVCSFFKDGSEIVFIHSQIV